VRLETPEGEIEIVLPGTLWLDVVEPEMVTLKEAIY